MQDKTLNVAIGGDHAGFSLKERIREFLTSAGHQVTDYGPDSDASADYPDQVHPLAAGLSAGKHDFGIIMCGSGNGVSMTANKYPDIRAALSWKPEIARLGRAHNNANVLALPARFISEEDALEAVQLFLHTAFEGGRHQNRVNKIRSGMTGCGG